MSYFSGAGSTLQGVKQTAWGNNSSAIPNVLLNITSATFDPTVEKTSEETLLRSQIKNGSYLASVTMDGSYSANLRPEMADFIFGTALGEAASGVYTLADAGTSLPASTYVFRKGNTTLTYPDMVVTSLSMSCPNNDFVTVDVSLKGREQIMGNASSAIDTTNLKAKTIQSLSFTKASYMVVGAKFKFNTAEKCISSCTIALDNGLEDAPRCYQDGLYANAPIMGMRAVTVDFTMPYDSDFIDTLQSTNLLSNTNGAIELTFKCADNDSETVKVEIPNVSILSVGTGVSGTGVIEASVSGEAVQPASGEPLTITVTHAE